MSRSDRSLTILLARASHLSLSAAVLLADQAAKAAIQAYLKPVGSLPVIPGWFDLTFVANQGALFGIGRGLGEPLRTVAFTLLPLTAILYILYHQWWSPPGDRRFQIGLALILGGAVGNLLDRIRLGHVVDFLDFYWRDYHWPAFNLADTSICVGVGLLGLDLLLKARAPGNQGD